MRFIKPLIKSIPFISYYIAGRKLLNDRAYKEALDRERTEDGKTPKRTDVINLLLSKRVEKTCYLEIGVRNPDDNYNRINADEKYSVDPGLEFKSNPVDFKMTSDEFFERLSSGSILSSEIRFDVIFIDGLHLADQVDRDIIHSLKFLKRDGFVVLHACNPPTEWHSREDYHFLHSPARGNWNGTTWKAFLKWRSNPSVHSCCIDSDWGIGVLSREHPIGSHMAESNPFFEFRNLAQDRNTLLNLVSFDQFRKSLT